MVCRASKNGWLNHEGKFYPCRFNHHCEASAKLEKKFHLKHSLEYVGWIKVHSAGVWFFEADGYHGRQYVKVTQAQYRWLLKHGYKLR